MAKQVGVIRIKGMLDDLIFYQDLDDGDLVRAKSYVSGEKVKTHPDYARTMANAMEFKAALYSGRLLRHAVYHLLFPIADSKLSGRMNRVMLDMVQQDRVNRDGERVAYEGDPKTLEGFEFNRHIALQDTFLFPPGIVVDAAGGQVHLDVPSFVPATHVTAAEYVKAIRLVSGVAIVDFKEKRYSHSFYETELITLNKEAVDPIRFSFPLTPGPGQVIFLLLGIQHCAKVDTLPKEAISKRKYWKVRKRRNAEGLAPFTGALSILQVIPGEARLRTPSNDWDAEGLGLA